MGLEPLLLSFIVVIIGGLGSIRGTIVAAFIIGISDGIISVFYEPTLAKMLATLFVAMVLVLKPSGTLRGGSGMRKKSLDLLTFFQVSILLLLFLLQFILPTYHHSSVSKIMVLASYAIGYNFLLGYTGLMSLGHAMFFASGMYAAGLGIYYLELSASGWIMLFGAAFTLVISLIFGLFALRTSGVSFLIVTLMFGQTFYLSILYFNEFTFGQDGFSLAKYLGKLVIFNKEYLYQQSRHPLQFCAYFIDNAYLLITTLIMLSPVGRILIAIRENESRTELLGYNVFYYKLFALVLSGTFIRNCRCHACIAVYLRRIDICGNTSLHFTTSMDSSRWSRHGYRSISWNRNYILSRLILSVELPATTSLW